MPVNGEQNRAFERFMLPVVIEVPEISEVPLVPEDIGVGGFGVLLLAEPEVGHVVDCTLQVEGDVFRNCRAKVMWARKDGSEEGAWKAGLAVALNAEARARLEEVLDKLVSEFLKED